MSLPITTQLVKAFQSGALADGRELKNILVGIRPQGNNYIIDFIDNENRSRSQTISIASNQLSSVLLSGTEDPVNSAGQDGNLYVNTVSQSLFIKNEGEWVALTSASGSIPQSLLDRMSAVETKNTEQDGRIDALSAGLTAEQIIAGQNVDITKNADGTITINAQAGGATPESVQGYAQAPSGEFLETSDGEFIGA